MSPERTKLQTYRVGFAFTLTATCVGSARHFIQVTDGTNRIVKKSSAVRVVAQDVHQSKTTGSMPVVLLWLEIIYINCVPCQSMLKDYRARGLHARLRRHEVILCGATLRAAPHSPLL